jgi:hypothetical protein
MRPDFSVRFLTSTALTASLRPFWKKPEPTALAIQGKLATSLLE